MFGCVLARFLLYVGIEEHLTYHFFRFGNNVFTKQSSSDKLKEIRDHTHKVRDKCLFAQACTFIHQLNLTLIYLLASR